MGNQYAFQTIIIYLDFEIKKFLIDEEEVDSEERIEAENDSERPKRAIDDNSSMEGVLKTELKFWNHLNMALQRQMRLLDDMKSNL